MPLGLRNASQTFQRFMDSLLRQLPFVRCYLDDLLIVSRSHEEHLKHLRQLFKVLRQTRLSINLGKCTFGQDSVTYLGYLITKDGYQPPPARVKAIEEFQGPSELYTRLQVSGLDSQAARTTLHGAERSRQTSRRPDLCNQRQRRREDILNRCTRLGWTDTRAGRQQQPLLQTLCFRTATCTYATTYNKKKSIVPIVHLWRCHWAGDRCGGRTTSRVSGAAASKKKEASADTAPSVLGGIQFAPIYGLQRQASRPFSPTPVGEREERLAEASEQPEPATRSHVPLYSRPSHSH